MHLFKSQWLQEPDSRIDGPAYREPGFGSRYGCRAASQQSFGNTVASHQDAWPGRDLQAERDILRRMARYDRGVRT